MSSENQGLHPSKPLEYLDLDTHLPYRLGMLTNLIRQATTNAYVRRSGLSGREWRVLGMIGLKGPLQPAETAKLTGMDRATITRAVDRLVELGYLLRQNDTQDGRKIELRLTKKGADKCDDIIPMMRDRGETFNDVLSEDELRDLYSILDKLYKQAVALVDRDAKES